MNRRVVRPPDAPLVIGLTGSIGMGKSAVASMLMAMDVPVFDADAVVRAAQGPGGALLPAIERAFPGSTGPDGVDRARLGAQVFNDDVALARLESIVHPAVARAEASFMTANAGASLVVLDIPLLLEKGGTSRVDRVVVVSAPADVQRDRVLARPGMSSAKLDAILTRQMPDDAKRAAADYVIDTGQSLDETRADVAALVACLRRESGA